MTQQELLHKAEQFIPGACLGMMYLPPDLRMVMVRGQGSRLWDMAGKEYIDYVLGSGPLILGHAHPAVVEAVQKQVALGSTYFALNEPAILLAEKICNAVPCGEAIRFQTTGSEATFAALRLARAFTRRDKILKFEGGWHGGHDVGQLSSAPSFGNGTASLPDFPEAVPDCDGIPDSARRDTLVAPFNDIETTTRIIDQHAQDIAAVIVEPLQRSLKPAPGFLEGLRAVTKKHGIVLIFDEIVTGFRLAWGGAQERYGVAPDLACYGKAISGGYPLSAVVGRRDILEAANPQRKGRGAYCFLSGTLTGNPVAAAAGLATLNALEQEGVYERLHHIGQYLARGIERIGRDAGVPVRVLGDGPVLQLFFTHQREILNHRDTLKANKQKAVRFGYELIRRGVYCTPGGKLYLSLAHSDEDLGRTLEIVEESIRVICG